MAGDAKAKADLDAANRRALARAAPVKAKLEAEEKLAEARAKLKDAEARRDWDAARDANYDICVWAAQLNKVTADVAISKLPTSDPARLEGVRARLDAERAGIASPFQASAHDARTAPVREEIDRRLERARTAVPTVDTLATTKAAIREANDKLAGNKVAQAMHRLRFEWAWGKDPEPGPEGGGGGEAA